jgi:hypothetical protein
MTSLDRAAVRADAFTFYSLATSSFLESAVEDYAANLALLFADDAEATGWLVEVWVPEESRHGRMARDYVAALWPDFDWDAAFRDYRRCIPRHTTAHLQPSRAQEALARCVTETQAAMMYRCMADYTEEPHLAELLRSMSRDEVRHYKQFQRMLERHDPFERPGLYRKGRTILERSALVRKRDLALVFDTLNAHWRCALPPVPVLTYREFLALARSVMQRHYPFEEMLRMILRPLLRDTMAGRYLAPVVARTLVESFDEDARPAGPRALHVHVADGDDLSA